MIRRNLDFDIQLFAEAATPPDSDQANVDTGAGKSGELRVESGELKDQSKEQSKDERIDKGVGAGSGTESDGFKPAEPGKPASPVTEGEWAEFCRKFVPEKRGEVELVTAADVAGFTPVAKELGLSLDQAGKLVSYIQETNRRAYEKHEANRDTAIGKYEAELRSDKEFAGADGSKFDGNVRLAIEGMKKLFGNNSEVIKFLTDSALGSHPAVVKGFLRIGLMEREGATFGGGASINTSSKDILGKMYDASNHK